MDTGSMALLLGNVSTPSVSTSPLPEKMSPMNLGLGIFTLVSLLVGTVSNSLILWVLGVKMKKTVNTLWFSHLIFTYLLYCSVLPVFSMYMLMDFHWVFGTVVCKLINTLFSLTMFTTVFLLTVISLDRYLLICHPIWSKLNRTVPRAWRVVAVVWLVSSILSAPYLAFREIRKVNGKKKCLNNYAFSSDWYGQETQDLRDRIHIGLFVFRFLLAFLLPLVIITACHFRMGWEMKKKRLVRNRKPFWVLAVSVASFFVCWLPFHLYRSSPAYWKSFSFMQPVLQGMMIVGVCFNFCFTPIFYLFVGEKFQQVFKTSLLSLLKRGFMDIPIIPVNSANDDGRQARSNCELEVKFTQSRSHSGAVDGNAPFLLEAASSP